MVMNTTKMEVDEQPSRNESVSDDGIKTEGRQTMSIAPSQIMPDSTAQMHEDKCLESGDIIIKKEPEESKELAESIAKNKRGRTRAARKIGR